MLSAIVEEIFFGVNTTVIPVLDEKLLHSDPLIIGLYTEIRN
jgi:hypothetical protein